MENEIMYIKLDDIIPNRFQPREVFDEEALSKLADSIRQHGVIEPILVRPVSNKYEIVVGERRYKASVLAGLTKIPAMVKQMDDKESAIVAYIENEHRSGVSGVEEARTIDRILKSNDMTQEELAKELGIKQSTLANKLRLLALPTAVQDALMHNEISERHARSLLTVKDENKQLELLKRIKENKMTVRELDSEIKNMNNNMVDSNQNNDNFMNYLNNYDNTAPAQEAGPANDNFMNYLNNYDNTAPAQEAPPANDNFMNYLNNYDNTAPVQEAAPASDNFMNYLNNYDNRAPVQEAAPANDNFMNYLNNYDNTAPAQEAAPANDNFMNYLNNYDNTAPSQEATPANDSFMNYLNNYDNSQPTPVAPADANFMNYLNDYDNNNPVIDDSPVNNPVIDQPEAASPDFMSYLNNYDNGVSTNIDNQNEDYSNYNNSLKNYENTSESFDNNYLNASNNNVVLNDINPPITSNFDNNSYIESNPNYVDITSKMEISDVDTIIDKLKGVVDDIKATSKYKIDTDEINYDDIYQITIKIDKRDF